MIKKLTFAALTFAAAALIPSCKSKTATVSRTGSLQAVQFRIARPTNNLEKIKTFYTQGVGLELLGSFADHAGYDGIMLGLPDKKHHLEFTQYQSKTALLAPTKENLMVFYFDSEEAYHSANDRIQQMGITSVEPENPYWKNKSETYEDPDGWRVIFFNGTYQP